MWGLIIMTCLFSSETQQLRHYQCEQHQQTWASVSGIVHARLRHLSQTLCNATCLQSE